jgi:HK97 family phage portal protein
MGWLQNRLATSQKMVTGNSAFTSGTGNFMQSQLNAKLIEEYKEMVYACITLHAQELAQYTPHFGRADSQGELIEDPRHPMKLLLNHPNDYQSQYELFEATSVFSKIYGEAFWYLEVLENSRLPVAIHLVQPNIVEVVVQDKQDVEGKVKVGAVAGYTVTTSQGRIPIERDEMIHFKTFNPKNPYRGLSPIEASLTSVQIDRLTGEFQSNFMANNATPSSIVALKGNISRDAFDKVKRMFSDRYAGTANAGKSLFIRDTDIDIKKLGLSLGELDLTALKEGSAERVRAAFGTPRALLGSTEGAGLSRANIEAEEYVFQKYQIEPDKTRLDDQLKLATDMIYKDKDIIVWHDSNIAQDRSVELAEDKELLNRVYTINEVRAKRGLDEIDGGDRLYVPFNLSELEQPQREPQSARASFKAIKKTKIAKVEKTLHEQLDAIKDRFEKRTEEALVKALDKQQSDVLTLIDRLAGKKNIQVTENQFNSIIVTNSLLDAIIQWIFVALNEGGDLGVLLAGQPDQRFLFEQATRNAVYDSTERMLQSFNLDTVEALQQQIARALDERLTIDELKANIESVYADAKGYRAERIARTETHMAANQGLAEAYQQSGYGYMKWVANPGACQYCAEMDGTITAIGSSFVEKGQSVTGEDGKQFEVSYRNVDYADLHPNCRCALEPVEESALKTAKYVELEDHTYSRLLETENDDLAKALAEQKTYTQELEKIVGINGQSDET